MTVLVADPDQRSRRLIAAALRRFGGYLVETARSATQATSLLRRRQIGAVILDPIDDAADTVTALRAQTDSPILIVSGSDNEWDKVAALDAGADAYLTKPIGTEELLARLRVAFRHLVPRTGPGGDDAPIITADFTIYLSDRYWVRNDGAEVRLTPIEWRIIEMLVRHAGHLVTQAELMQGVWGPKAVEKTHYLRVQMAGIRRKVEPEPAHPRYFITVPGLGVRFDPTAGGQLQQS